MPTVTKGLLGRKLGMTQIFDDAARAIPVTVIEAGPCKVAQVKTPERDGYSAVQLAYDEDKKLSKPEIGHLAKAKLGGHRHLVELRLADTSGYALGQEITVGIFEPGERTDVVGVSKGKGFTGVMKRHNFHGTRATHGVERKHRTPGSVGAGTTPGRVFPGQKLPGHHGHERVTVLNLEVVKVDAERNLLLIKGAVPGPDGGLVMIRSAVRTPKRTTPRNPGSES